jgi:hypothetical protein
VRGRRRRLCCLESSRQLQNKQQRGKKKKLFSFHPGKNPAASDNFDGFIVRQLAELRQPKRGEGGREIRQQHTSE